MAVITVSNLRKRFNLEAGFFARFGRFVDAVRGLSFSVNRNENYGLVGESGCGKTTAARLLVRMYESDGGSVFFRDTIDVSALKKKELREYRQKVKYVFQDPARSLNPRMSVYEVLVSGYRWSPGAMRQEERRGAETNGGKRIRGHTRAWEKQAREEAGAILEEVGLSREDLEKRPAEFSGGQRQRISIARGLLMKPDLLVCDEIVSALDVSIQGQILNLLLDIREKRDLSFLFIAHDLRVASHFCDRIGVMYRGELMEEAPAADLWKTGSHPYTRLLFSSAPGLSESAGAQGETAPAPVPPAPSAPPEDGGEGEERCAFAGRCPIAAKQCFEGRPLLRETGGGHKIRCFNV
ncbi:MAG: ATP-binding cassette domain-containing protein [Treponema sp.]|jgi:oligopeptide/dipeptide ABC transporter ATP-binding protein|nr:ATP-binding cassette domain-containing protein [Treponema sp.]